MAEKSHLAKLLCHLTTENYLILYNVTLKLLYVDILLTFLLSSEIFYL